MLDKTLSRLLAGLRKERKVKYKGGKMAITLSQSKIGRKPIGVKDYLEFIADLQHFLFLPSCDHHFILAHK